MHSREFEVGVLHWFARLWEIEPADMWGYITNCGTEGNLHGILVGRENLPDGVLYCSKVRRESDGGVLYCSSVRRESLALPGECFLVSVSPCLSLPPTPNLPSVSPCAASLLPA